MSKRKITGDQRDAIVVALGAHPRLRFEVIAARFEMNTATIAGIARANGFTQLGRRAAA